MATLEEYFRTDFPHHMSIGAEGPIVRTADGVERINIRVRVHFDFTASAKYVSALLPDVEDTISVVDALLRNVRELIDKVVGPAEVRMGFGNLPWYANSTELAFTGRVFLYAHNEPGRNDWEAYVERIRSAGLYPVMRGDSYVTERNRIDRPKAFICHDSRDKEAVALPIAQGLQKRLCPVWYDDYALNVGDSLRECIEEGIKQAGTCILVLSPSFLGNRGWTRAEFDSIYTREVLEKNHLFLPIWHGVGVREVYEYCPRLADRRAVNTEVGMEEVINQLHRAIVRRG